MKLTFFLLISHTVIGMTICEVIEIRVPTESRRLNSSAILDKAILHTKNESLKYNARSEGPLNFTLVPWPITRILRDKNPSPNFEDSPDSKNYFQLPVTRAPKNFYTSVNLPSKNLERRQIIPAGQSMYPSWGKFSVKTNNMTSDGKKSNTKEIHDDTTHNDAEKRDLHLVPTIISRYREERRKNVGNKHQFSKYDENIHDSDEYYENPEKYFEPSNYELENTDTYGPKYGSPQSGRYGLENYDSYSTENYKNNRYLYESGADLYSENLDHSPSRHPHLNMVNSRFTVDSYAEPVRAGPSSSLIAIFFAIGSNLLQLFKIGLGSGLSIAIFTIAIKLFLIPLKILKFIKIVKILLKLIFVVPFILRMFGPSIYSAIGYHDAGFTNKMAEASTPESRDVVDQTNEQPPWWNNLATNLTSALPAVASVQKCPSRVACELGSYLASRSTIPKKLTMFLANENPEESKDFKNERNDKAEVTRAFLRALTQRWTYDRCDVFTCGISL